MNSEILVRHQGMLRHIRQLLPAENVLKSLSAGASWSGFTLEEYQSPATEFPDCEFSNHMTGISQVSVPPCLYWKEKGVEHVKRLEPKGIFVRSQQPLGAIRWDGFLCMRILSIGVQAMENALPEPLSRPAVELVPLRVGAPDPVLEYLIAAIHAEIEANCPTGRLLMEALGNTTALYLAHRYGSQPCRLPSSQSGLSCDRAKRVMDYIDTYLSSDLSVDELASVACLSPYHFGKMFKRSMGQSVHAFVTGRRIERAKFLLKSSTLSLGEIGALVGFAEQSHFTTVFKHCMGITPKGYRQEMMPRCA